MLLVDLLARIRLGRKDWNAGRGCHRVSTLFVQIYLHPLGWIGFRVESIIRSREECIAALGTVCVGGIHGEDKKMQTLLEEKGLECCGPAIYFRCLRL